jgi:hypothetical protein
MSRDLQITFDCHDPRSLSSFWSAVLGYVIPGPPGVPLDEGDDPLAAWDVFLERIGVPESERNSRSAIEDPDGTGPRVFFQQVPEDKVVKNRVHLDVRVGTGLVGQERLDALEAEAVRLEALGASRVQLLVADGFNESCQVMQDVEGNEFCLD